MDGNEFTTVSSGVKQIFTKIPVDYKDDLINEFLDINIKREKFIAIFITVLVVPLVIMNLYLEKSTHSDVHPFKLFVLWDIVSLIITLTFLFTINITYKGIKENYKIKRFLHITSTTLFLTLSSIIALHNIMEYRQPFIYTIAVFCAASLILYEPNERLIAFGIPYLSFIIGIIIIKDYSLLKMGGLFFFTLLTLIAYLLSMASYGFYAKNFVDRRIIIENNIKLNELNKFIQNSLNKRTEELNGLIENDKLRTNFFANISHELRTPLTIISSAQQMLNIVLKDNVSKEKTVKVNQYLHVMEQNCNRLQRLISNLIDITKIDTGYFNVNLGNHDIVSIVEDITLSIAQYIEDTNIRLTFDTEVEEKVVACDPEKIERIMLNLLSNAVKFTPEGGDIFVNIFDRDDKVVISVKDTGIGIPCEMKDLIFERFVQLDELTTRKSEGSGIGLSIVKSLVTMHGGNIYVNSITGAGCEFVVEIPNRTIADSKVDDEHNLVRCEHNKQKIKIEFSDIKI